MLVNGDSGNDIELFQVLMRAVSDWWMMLRTAVRGVKASQCSLCVLLLVEWCRYRACAAPWCQTHIRSCVSGARRMLRPAYFRPAVGALAALLKL